MSIRGACCEAGGGETCQFPCTCDRVSSKPTHDVATAEVAPEARLDKEIAAARAPAVVTCAGRLSPFEQRHRP